MRELRAMHQEQETRQSAKNGSSDEKKRSKDAGNRAKEREGLSGTVIAPRYERDSAGNKRVPQRKERGMVPRNERDGTKRACNDADKHKSAAKKGKGDREGRCERVIGKRENDLGTRTTHTTRN